MTGHKALPGDDFIPSEVHIPKLKPLHLMYSQICVP